MEDRKRFNFKLMGIVFLIFLIIHLLDQISTIRCYYIYGTMDYELNILLKGLFYKFGMLAFPIHSFFVICYFLLFICISYFLFMICLYYKKDIKLKIICLTAWIIVLVIFSLYLIQAPINNFKVC